MDDSMSVQVLNSRKHLTHDICSVMLRESLCCNDAIEEFATLAMLHDNVHVTMIDVTLIKLDNVGMVDRLQNSELFLQKFDIFCDVFAED